jgi:hypothetical protein
MTERDEHHLTEERLRQLASEPKLRPSDVENAHIDDCSQCLGRLIELVKMFYDVGDPDQD